MVRVAAIAQELVQKVSSDKSFSSNTRKWVKETFDHEELPRTTMAFHVLFFFAHWKATSGVENTFNIWKKYLANELKKYVCICHEVQCTLTLLQEHAVRFFQNSDGLADATFRCGCASTWKRKETIFY